MPDDSKLKADAPSNQQGVERRQNERRRGVRFPFTAPVDATESLSKVKISGRTSDISEGGCYVDTISPFPVGTNIKICIAKDSVTFEADAKVTLSQLGMGMGIVFISAMPQQIRIFQRWLSELQGKPSREPVVSKHAEKDGARGNSMHVQDYVLSELLLVLTRKGIISDDEGKAMLRKLYR